MQYAYPDNDLSYEGNFLNMMFKTTELKYQPNPVLERALTVLYILHADHEQNCSTNAMRKHRQCTRQIRFHRSRALLLLFTVRYTAALTKWFCECSRDRIPEQCS
jgi:hypothetical protein